MVPQQRVRFCIPLGSCFFDKSIILLDSNPRAASQSPITHYISPVSISVSITGVVSLNPSLKPDP